MKISIYKDSGTYDTDVEFADVVNAIRLGHNLNMLFSPSGVIHVSGNKKNTLIYTGLVLLTFDTGSSEELERLFQRVTEMSTTYCCFRNHLGNGLKVLVKTDCWDGHHKTGYNQVVEAYQNYLNLEVSNHQPDIYILCHLSHDPNTYYNPESRVFKVDIKTKKQIVAEAQLYEQYRDEFEEQVKTTERYIKLTKKTWNDYYGVLASNCFNAGIPITSTLEFIMRSSYLNIAIKGIVKRVYQKLARKKKSTSDVVFSLYFNNFLNYKLEIKPDERIFFEVLVYKSIRLGIPFYYTDEDVKKELGLKRSRRETIEGKFTKMRFLHVYTKKVKTDDKWKTTHYRLIMQNFEDAVNEIMVDPTYFLRTVMPLLAQKDSTRTGYFLTE